MKTSTILAIAPSVLSVLGAPPTSPEVRSLKRQTEDIGWEMWIGVRHGLQVCAGVPVPCDYKSTWVMGKNLDDFCGRVQTGSPFPVPITDVQYCDIEFSHPDFCEGAKFKMNKGQDSDCGLNGGSEIRFAALFDMDGNEIGVCEKDYSKLDGHTCTNVVGSNVYSSLLKCTVSWAPGRCGSATIRPPRL